ncbi:MAG: VOC family protein [Robiginitalea sp.]|jgi:catechol 2,3-dioxygenase-like lactoylglutathione lyase family enzyme
MKKLIFIFCLCTLLKVFPQSEGISAIGYVVENINSSVEFYTNVIGMEPAGSFDLDSDWSRDAGAAGNKPFSVKMFRLGSGPEATVLKLAYFKQSAPRVAQNALDSPAGINYITLKYQNLHPVVRRAKEAGIPILGHVIRDSYQLVFIRDPDGLFLELVGPPEPPLVVD